VGGKEEGEEGGSRSARDHPMRIHILDTLLHRPFLSDPTPCSHLLPCTSTPPPLSLARPKVLYNAAHRTYVLLVQLMGAPPNVTTTITQQDNSSSSSSRAAPSPPPAPPPVAPGPSLGAATSISPYGPFTWRGAFPAEELGYGDMDAAGDGDSGEGYLVRRGRKGGRG
jgi:hypothetical protein